MKIFNWVHKRFYHNTIKDGFASNMKKTEPTTNNADSQALLKHVPLTDLFGGWEDGILTIGTFGYGHLKSINHNNEYFALETEQGERKGEDDGNCYNNAEMEEVNPLMQNIFENNFDDVVVSANHDAINANKEGMVSTFTEIIVLSSPVISNEVKESNDAESDENNKGERITLADLFFADSEVKMKLYPSKFFLESSEKPSLKAKHGLSFAKNLIPNQRPMKDIKKLMKKMLKRKIHPDLDIKNHKPEGREASPSGIIDDHMNEWNNESTYFLPI
ncbi:PREDICTED: uncharacterized protein LOC109356383 isoform X2 [Lupinus angustifolius]|uniref:uncharacterized protein LOC109356383 isoform X2 n=1 Tax=Lupinus angustifolius TaxID=3871 RepID=UPI00092EDF21|nr:PREDICTED: uncharacterized protein LOC109356383 isoform X2 [Lupinus angustifolius]